LPEKDCKNAKKKELEERWGGRGVNIDSDDEAKVLDGEVVMAIK